MEEDLLNVINTAVQLLGGTSRARPKTKHSTESSSKTEHEAQNIGNGDKENLKEKWTQYPQQKWIDSTGKQIQEPGKVLGPKSKWPSGSSVSTTEYISGSSNQELSVIREENSRLELPAGSLQATPDSRNTSNSSTGSEILRRSTSLMLSQSNTSRSSAGNSISSSSNVSKGSQHSFENAKTIKISSRKLREIKSPFEDDHETPSAIEENIAPPLITRGEEMKKKSGGILKPGILQGHHSGDTSAKTPVDEQADNTLKNCDIKEDVHVGFKYDDAKDKAFGNMLKKADTKHSVSSNRAMQSVDHEYYKTGNTKSWIERNYKDNQTVHTEGDDEVPTVQAGENDELIATVEKHKTFTGRISNDQNALVYRTSPKKIQPDNYHQAKNRDPNEPEIITIQDEITTIHAQNYFSESSSNDSNDSGIQQKVINKYSRVYQGERTKEPMLSARSVLSDVSVSTYHTDKRVKAKGDLVKRAQSNVPIKRVVMPKFVEADSSELKAKSDVKEQVETVAAAVAASAAVAATQPIYKVQFQLESQLNEIMNKISNLQTAPSQPQINDSTSEKLLELEKRLAELTERRLEHIEKLQQQQLEWQAKVNLMALQAEEKDKYTRVPCTCDYKMHFPEQKKDAVEKTPLSLYRAASHGQQYTTYPVTNERSHDPFSVNQKYTSQQNEDFSRAVPMSVESKKTTFDTDLKKATSPLDTPAPRRIPPLPTYKGYNGRQAGQNLFEAILSTEETPVKDLASSSSHAPVLAGPRSSFPPSGYLGDPPVTFRISPTRLISDGIQEISQGSETVPLDKYLKQHTKTSPVILRPATRSVSHLCSDILDTLERTQATRKTLDHNFNLVQRARRPLEVDDGSLAGNVYFKTVVDAYIQTVTSEIQRDLAVAKDKKVDFSHMEPERDISTKQHQKPPVRGKRNKTETKMQARSATRKSQLQQNNNSLTEQQTSWKPVPEYKDERYMTRVYGKALTTSPKRKREVQSSVKVSARKTRPDPALVTKGVKVQSSQTQTKVQRGAVAPSSIYKYNMQQPQRGMAVALGAPRVGGLTIAEVQTLKTHPSPPGSPEISYTPEPLEQAPVLEDIDDPEPSPQKPSTSRSSPRKPAESNMGLEVVTSINKRERLSRQTLPSVNIDCTESKQVDENEKPDTVDSSIDEESLHGEGIAFPGSRELAAGTIYNGPQFPPQCLPPKPVRPTSDQLAATIAKRDLLENRAATWIEQEIMARIISSMQQPQGIARNTHQQVGQDMKDDESSDSESSKLLDFVGQDGFQLFVDAGQPVDPELVNSLVKEVLNEQIASMIGNRLRETSAINSSVVPEETIPKVPVSMLPRIAKADRSPVPTPQATPNDSLRASPMEPSSPNRTPVQTPEPTLMESDTETPPQDRLSRLDVSTQFTPAPLSQPSPEPRSPTPQSPRQDVKTPETTPPATPTYTRVATPTVSEKQTSPIPGPQPWGDPDSPLSEEGCEKKMGDPAQNISAPVVVSVDEEPESFAVPQTPLLPANPPETPKPVTPAPPIDQPTEQIASSSSPESISETVGQEISEGQWLLSQHSAGQVEGPKVDKSLDASLASTLHSTSELSEPNSFSEGQVIPHKEKDPIVALLAKMQQTHIVPVASLGEVVFNRQKENTSQAGDNGYTSPGEVPRSYSAVAPTNVAQAPHQSSPWSSAGNKTMNQQENSKPLTLADLDMTKTRQESNQPRSSDPPPAGHIILVQSSSNVPSTIDDKPLIHSRSDEILSPPQSLNRPMSADARTLTPDQINVDAMLQSGYLAQTFSSVDTTEMMTTDKSGQGMTRTFGSAGERSLRGTAKQFTKTLDSTGFYDSFKNIHNEGLTQTLDGTTLYRTLTRTIDNQDDRALTHTLDDKSQTLESIGDQILTHTIESLSEPELTQTLDSAGDTGKHEPPVKMSSGPLTVSIKMPSVHGVENSESEDDDISEISMAN